MITSISLVTLDGTNLLSTTNNSIRNKFKVVMVHSHKYFKHNKWIKIFLSKSGESFLWTLTKSFLLHKSNRKRRMNQIVILRKKFSKSKLITQFPKSYLVDLKKRSRYSNYGNSIKSLIVERWTAYTMRLLVLVSTTQFCLVSYLHRIPV